jgi:YidC/Oxa1 family membrane protein insertase
MYFMPIIMIFFFWSMPSGVTLYWTVQNIISVVWQLAVEKFSKEEKA